MKNWGAAAGAVAVLLIAGVVVYYYRDRAGTPGGVAGTPTPAAVAQLPVDQHPKVEMTFSADGHEVTVSLSNLNASRVEYNLIYDADVIVGRATQRSQRGVSAEADIDGKSTYSQEQLLGSESSGKRVYHTNIDNAMLELTLRDSAGRSVFSATYPFEVAPGKTISIVSE